MADKSGSLINSTLLITCSKAGFTGTKLQAFGDNEMIKIDDINDAVLDVTVDNISIGSRIAAKSAVTITLHSASDSCKVFNAIRNLSGVDSGETANIESLDWSIKSIGLRVSIKNATLTGFGAPSGTNKLGNRAFKIEFSTKDYQESQI